MTKASFALLAAAPTNGALSAANVYFVHGTECFQVPDEVFVFVSFVYRFDGCGI